MCVDAPTRQSRQMLNSAIVTYDSLRSNLNFALFPNRLALPHKFPHLLTLIDTTSIDAVISVLVYIVVPARPPACAVLSVHNLEK